MFEPTKNGNEQVTAAKLLPGLYIVSTPIGAARDITLRALDVLSVADIIAAEDTRNTRRLLDIHDVSLGDRRLVSYHDHNGQERRPYLLSALESGKSIALVSDAGTPLLADPGYHLAHQVREAGFDVIAVPGASALLSALCIAGQPTDKFFFAGFLPTKPKARQDVLHSFMNIPSTLVFYEVPKRLAASLADMASVLGGERTVSVCRELTKKFEETRQGTLGNLAHFYENSTPPKGEVVVVIGPPLKKEITAQEIDSAILTALKEMTVKDTAKQVSNNLGVSRKQVYDRALELRDGPTT